MGTLRAPTAAGRFLLVALLGGRTLYACSEDRPAPASASTSPPAGLPSLRPADAGVVDDASAARCSTCTQMRCNASLTSCANDAVCAGCFDASTTACFANAAFGAIFDCTCQSCPVECDLTCADVSCVRCAVAQCRAELDACVNSAACAACVADDPPPACATDSLAAALFTCTKRRCSSAGCR